MIIIDGGLTFTLVGYVGSNTSIVHIPSSAQDGDFGVMIDLALNSAAGLPTFVTPSGWSNTINDNGTSSGGGGARLNISRRILSSSDPDTDATGMNGTLRNRKLMIILRPSRPIQSTTLGGWSTRCTATDPGSILVPAAAAATAGAAVVIFGLAASQNAIDPFSWTPAADDVNSDGTGVTLAGFKLYQTDTTPADHTIDIDDEGDINGLAAGYFVFT